MSQLAITFHPRSDHLTSDAPHSKRKRLALHTAATLLLCAFLYLSLNDGPLRALPLPVERLIRLVMLVGIPVIFWLVILKPLGPSR